MLLDGRRTSLHTSTSGSSVSIDQRRFVSACAILTAVFLLPESRNDPSTSPTSIYLGGGPGITSLDGMSGFPCFINPDSNSTTLNEYSWSKNVNILYIDQPVGTGFTYVDLQNGILDVLTQSFEPVSSLGDLPALNHTALPATLDITGPATAANTTLSAARTMWRFAQVWFNEYVRIARSLCYEVARMPSGMI